MECTIPETRNNSSEQYIHCIIDIIKFPLIDSNSLVLPDEFNIDPFYGIFNWENIDKYIYPENCALEYNISFSSIDFLNTECYSNGFNSFIVDGNILPKNNFIIANLSILKCNINAIIDSQYDNISCEMPEVLL